MILRHERLGAALDREGGLGVMVIGLHEQWTAALLPDIPLKALAGKRLPHPILSHFADHAKCLQVLLDR